ncbi:MAG: SMC-Scp complex subunit ScpB [Syntrophomonadaceae bacterium]|jgi:segregation and condensation protein B
MLIIKEEIMAAVEAILFVRAEPVKADELVELLNVPLMDIKQVMRELIQEYKKESRGIQIIECEGGYLMCSKPELTSILASVIKPERKRLSPAALETLAIIAYQQPVTRLEIENIRGVKVDRIISSLLEKGLIKEAGHKDTLGKPVVYATTDEFLRIIGLTSLKELPQLREES